MLAIVGILVVLVAIGLYGEHEINAPQGTGSNPVSIPIRAGDTPSAVATRLEVSGLLHNTLVFGIDARLRGLGSKLHVGTFTLKPDMSIDQMISTLAGNKVQLLSVTIPEGLRAEQIAEILSADGINGQQFLSTVRHPHFHLGFHIPHLRRHGLEGFLFPDTYTVAPGTSGAQFARIMVRRFDQVFDHRMRVLARKEHRSIFHVVIMASIVEREDRFPNQKPLIASVYYNRLRIGMMLQSDPTVQYAAGRLGDWWPQLPSDRTHILSPYNTFLHRGYPRGPIANPGLGSLLAALHPAHTDYYYFAGKGNTGELLFASTYQQFLNNLSKYG